MNEIHQRRTTPTDQRAETTAVSDYAALHNRLSVAWKSRTATLPEGARLDGVYRGRGRALPTCLPAEYAKHNLLPDVRDGALDLFASLDIPWHDSVAGGPSNHLRDSQVQCVNALFPMVSDPDRIRRAFGGVVDIAEMLPVEDDRLLTFEFIGPTDYFDEGLRNGVRTPRRRGTRCTSVDAAFRYRTASGDLELALVEWKFTESYLRPVQRDETSDEVRIGRYGVDLSAPDSPVADDVLPIRFLLDEPFYQLVRQQLLAHRLERNGVLGADRVRVLHVLSPDNADYQASLPRPAHCALGGTVDEVWARLLRTPDRFRHVDPAVFLDPEVTSDDYVDRYSTEASR